MIHRIDDSLEGDWVSRIGELYFFLYTCLKSPMVLDIFYIYILINGGLTFTIFRWFLQYF